MVSKHSPSDSAESSTRRNHRPPTIELAATEIATGPAEAQTSTDASSSEASIDAPPSGNSSASSKRAGIAWLPSGAFGPLLGAAGALLVLALFWLTGFFGGGSGVLTGRIAAIETQLRELPARPAPASTDANTINELSARLAKVESATVTPPPPPLSDAALANRLTSAENATKAFADDIGSLNRRAEDLANALREMRGRVDAVAAGLVDLQNAVRTIAPAADRGEIETQSNRIAALERAAATLQAELDKRATLAGDRMLRLAMASAALRIAVERGEPFAAELAAVRQLTAGTALAALEPFAAAGAPTNAALARELSALAPALRRAAGAVPVEGGFFDRLKANAERLIRIRPIDETSGDDPAAVIARIEVKAAHADVVGAFADLAKLPAPMRAPAQSWIGKAEARIAAVETSRQIAADAINALGKASP